MPVIMRPAVLARLMDGYTTVMVTGTHGKTTTTSMIIVALQHSGFDPSFAVGGDLGEAGTNAHHGSGDVVRRRGRRERRLAARVHARRRGGDQRRGRPPGLLRQRRGLRARSSTSSSSGCGPAARWWSASTIPVPRHWPSGRAARGVRVLRYGSGEDPNLAGALLNWEQQGTGSVATIRLAGESHPRGMRLAVPGRHMALNALGALLAAMEVGADVSSRCSTASPGSRACDAGSSRSALRRGCASSTTTPTIPTEVRATLEAVRGGGGRGPLDRGVPAAPVLPDPDLRAGVRAGAVGRRRGLRARRVRGAGSNRWPE